MSMLQSFVRSTLLAASVTSGLAAAAEARPTAPSPETEQAPPSTAPAAEAPAPETRPSSGVGVEISVKAGVHVSQVLSRLQTNFDVVLKLGLAPLLQKRLQVFVDLGYSQPPHVTDGSDPRLGASGAEYRSKLVVHDLRVSGGLCFFFLPPDEYRVVPWAGAAFRAHFLRADVTAQSGDAAFGDHAETATRYGFHALAGVGVRVGPGRLLLELDFGFAPLSERVTGSSNIGALSVLGGYGLMF